MDSPVGEGFRERESEGLGEQADPHIGVLSLQSGVPSPNPSHGEQGGFI